MSNRCAGSPSASASASRELEQQKIAIEQTLDELDQIEREAMERVKAAGG